MRLVPVLLAAVLLVLAFAFGLHCLVLHCDRRKSGDEPREREGSPERP